MRKSVFFILCCFTCSAFAIPGADTIQAIKQIALLAKQLHELKQQVKEAKQMVDQGRDALKDAEGHYGFGNLLDSASNFRKRSWAPGTWSDALKTLSGGNSARYQELLKAYDHDHPTLSDRQFLKGAGHSLLHRYKDLTKVNKASTVMATEEFDDIKNKKDRLHSLAQKIESAPNTKAAIDLNSRLIAELSYVSIEALRMQTLTNHQLAAQASDDLSARKNEAIFNQLPKEK